MHVFCISMISKAGKFKSEVYIKIIFSTLLSTYSHSFDYFPMWDTFIRNKCSNRLWNKVWKLRMILQGQNIPLKKTLIISYRQNLAFVAFLWKELFEYFTNYELSCTLKVIFFIVSQFSKWELYVASFI